MFARTLAAFRVPEPVQYFPMPALKPQHAAFAQAIAAGTAGADAYAALYPRASRKTATEKASRRARNGNIRARIEDLRSALADAQARRDAEVARDVASKLTVTLLTSQERRSMIATRVRRADITDSALARLLYLDAQLAGDLVEKQDLSTNGENLPSVLPPIIINLPERFTRQRGTGKPTNAEVGARP